MKLIIEVVATNMNTGHVAINQETIEICSNMPRVKAVEQTKKLVKELNDHVARTNKIGDILITRSYTGITG